jgi:hypothetical protein
VEHLLHWMLRGKSSALPIAPCPSDSRVRVTLALSRPGPISTHNVTYNAGSHRSLNSPISHSSPRQVALCKLHTHYIL